MHPSQSHSANGVPTRLYFLKLDNTISNASETTTIPLHMLENNYQYGNEPFNIISILPAKENSQEPLQVHENKYQAPSNSNNHQNTCVAKTVLINTIQNAEAEKCTENVVKSNIPPAVKTIITPITRSPKLQNYVHIGDKIVPQRAIAVLPTVLQLRRGNISPRKSLSARVRFGPLEGIKKEISQTMAQELVLNVCQLKTPLFLIMKNNESVIHIDVKDKDKSNWLSLLPLGDQDTANVWLYEENNELYAITTQTIAARKPLLLGYSKQYAEDHGFSADQPIIDIDAENCNGVKKWWCYECERGFPSAALLQRHVDTYHKEKPVHRQRYSCRYCTRKFSRLFSLKRHMLTSCFKRADKTKSSNKESAENSATNTCNKEDNRIPSDESFNNYSNSLDFSTNLFDTDRIPGLDMSSRSESEFNSFVMGYKDDNCLSTDLGFDRITTGTEMPVVIKSIEEKHIEFNLIACQYCNKIIEKETKQHHFRECTRRRYECECGRQYTNKKKLINHIRTEHSTEQPSNNDLNTKKTDATPYKCEKCQHGFKRRGMLVNHLWRIHKSVSTAVPLERRVRHYLCGACSKIYRTAAKRNRHIRLHHPGSEKVCAQTIEGAVQVCEPAVCGACPRQYATRAKLLQHMRLHHPHLMATEKPLIPEASDVEKPSSEETNRNQIVLQQLLSIY